MVVRDFTVGAQALAWLDAPGGSGPAEPRPAATVLLLRDGRRAASSEGVEVFVMRRRASMAFAARMHAFPGGGVDARDSEPGVPWTGPSPREWGAALGCSAELAGALVCAAVRELFEECGVLLAGASADDVVADVSGDDWEEDRLALLDRSLALSQLLIRRGLRLRSDLLRPWAHWLTPVFEPRRFDTWFFLAALPVGQIARDVGGEADRAEWFGLGELLAEHSADRLPMLPPTRVAVEDLVSALADARRHGAQTATADGRRGVEAAMAAPRVLTRVMPWVTRSTEGAAVLRVDLDGRGGGLARADE